MFKRRTLILSLLVIVGLLAAIFSTAESDGRIETLPEGASGPASTARLSASVQAAEPQKTGTVGASASLAPRQAQPGSGFGHAIAVDGDTVVVGAPQSDAGRGAVYVFVRDGKSWRETSRLVASNRAANDAFGQSVAISAGTIVVGASGQDARGFNTGAAYIFQLEKAGWVESAKLLPASAQDVHFGWSVAVDGDTLAVGAPYRYLQGEISKVGSVSVFTRQDRGWEQQVRLTSGRSGGAVNNDLFGWSVDIHASRLAVGAYLSNAVYLYQLSDGRWQQETLLKGPRSSAQFGYSVSLDKDMLAVGAPATNSRGMRTGTAFLYLRQSQGWQEQSQISTDRLRPGSRLGWSVSLQGDLLAVGMRESDGPGDNKEAGGAYALRIASERLSQTTELYAPDPAPFDHFGSAVAVSAQTIFVGAPGSANAPGVVAAFEMQGK